MSEVHYDDFIDILNTCPSIGDIHRSEEPCNHCKFQSELDCRTALIRAAAIQMKFLQDAVNEYSKYDGFLYAHGFFRSKDDSSKSEPKYVTTCSCSDSDHSTTLIDVIYTLGGSD